jgi:membrane protein DedA with SNARE-associated domain
MAALFSYTVNSDMNNLLAAISHHGYLLLFLMVLAEASGLPAPAAVALVAAGAGAAAHILSAPLAFGVAIAGTLLGDLLLFFVGRYTGWALLSFICSLSLNPETCILRSAESFHKRGRMTLIFAKFVPGVNTMAPPLAGSMKMRPMQFLQLDLLGAALYVLVYGALGYLFRDFLADITHGLVSASHTALAIAIAAAVLYVLYRVVQYRRFKLDGVVPRVEVEELAQRLASVEKQDIILADVRSHGYYDAGAARIAGSIRLEPTHLDEELKILPRDKDIFLYCT